MIGSRIFKINPEIANIIVHFDKTRDGYFVVIEKNLKLVRQ